MKKERKPIRRSRELAPLSREHHEGLLLVFKIRQGIRKKIDIKRITDYVHWFWENDLREHFDKEEQILAPSLPAEHEWVLQMKKEHNVIKEQLEDLGSAADDTSLEKLATLINDHIRFEERVLFPFAEERLNPAQLETIYHKLAEQPSGKSGWPDEFWL